MTNKIALVSPSDDLLQLASEFIDSDGKYFNTDQMRVFLAKFGELVRKHEVSRMKKKLPKLGGLIRVYAQHNNLMDEDVEFFLNSVVEMLNEP